MPTIQVRVDDKMKREADTLFSDLGFDTSTALRVFIAAAIREGGMPFDIKRTTVSDSWSEGYVKKLEEMWKSPDPTFAEQPDLPITDRGELFE